MKPVCCGNTGQKIRPGRLAVFKGGIFVVVFFAACSILRVPEEQPVHQATESGLVYTVLRQGEGPQPSRGDMVRVHYTGMLADGTVFDSSYDRSQPVEFQMGSGQVISGWEEGIALLREGSKASFIIPPDLGYGDTGFGMVPENETLTFEVELLEVYTPERIEEETVEPTMPARETASGVKYSLTQQGEGIRLEEEMHVSLHYTGYIDAADQVKFDSSYDRDQPLRFILGRKMVIPGLDDALTHLRVGDRARIWVPHALAYGSQGRGPIPPESDLIFDVEVIDAMPVVEPGRFDTSGRDTLTTASGLRYIIVEEGYGEKPRTGNILLVHYSGYTSDGSIFDSSIQRSEPFRFVLGTDQVIQGWDEAFALLREGSKARLIIPPSLGYGDTGRDPVPPGETLIFDVELLEVRR